MSRLAWELAGFGIIAVWLVTRPAIRQLGRDLPRAYRAVAAAFPVVTLFELLAPLALFSRWFRRAWLAVIVGFHLGSWWLMQIWFLHNVLLLPVLFRETARDSR